LAIYFRPCDESKIKIKNRNDNYYYQYPLKELYMTEIKQYENIIEKHKEKIREVEAYTREHGNDQVSYTPEQIKALVDSGYIPKELGEWELKHIEEINKKHKEMHEFKKNNPNMSPDEFMNHFFKKGHLSTDETIKFYEDTALGGLFLKFILENKHLLTGDVTDPNKLTAALFKNVDPNTSFGIERFMTDSIYHLENLLKEMELMHIHSTVYEAIGCTSNSKKEEIKLSYIFHASSKEEAENLLAEYKKTMATKGLKIWMAHWLMANETGKLEYACPMIEVMKRVAEEDREAFFSTKEKEEHWAITRMLGTSKLRRERKIKKRGSGKEVVQWIEQPLLEILGGEKELETDNKYPNLIAVRVLVPMDEKGFVPAIYNNSTILLRPSDVFIAFKIQTRAAQRGHGTKTLRFDWDFLFEAGNLQATAISKKAVAKAQTRKKMDRLKENKIIEEWEENLIGMDITPKQQKKKEKVEDTKGEGT